MESYKRVERKVSVVENLESWFTPDHVMRMLAFAWIVPAVSLCILGMTEVAGFAIIDATGRVQRLHEVRAVVTLLSILTVLVGTIWALRSWDLLPGLGSIKQDSWRLGPKFHGLALAVAAAAIFVAPFVDGTTSSLDLILWWTAAVAAFVGGSLLPRWLRQIGEFSSQSMAFFAAVIVYQLTIGWLHMVTWTAVGSIVLLAEGIAMAVFSVAAAFAVPAFGRRHLRIAEPPVLHDVEAEITIIDQVEISAETADAVVEEPAVVR